jgi:drug/metabolite transporter (DMT)-like permease
VSDFWPIDTTGVIYAILSGALASGVGYAIWYAALPALSRTSAGVVQLTVPAIATLGGILFIGEALTLEFTIASIVLLAGVGLATAAKS